MICSANPPGGECKRCGKALEKAAFGPMPRYCGRACCQSFNREVARRAAGVPVDRVERECDVCGRGFTSVRWNQVYCDAQCRTYALNRARLRRRGAAVGMLAPAPWLIAKRAEALRAGLAVAEVKKRQARALEERLDVWTRVVMESEAEPEVVPRRDCPVCGGKVPEGKRRDAVYCSVRCRSTATTRLAAGRPVGSPEGRRCGECGGPIPKGRRVGAKYCGRSCAVRVVNRRRRRVVVRFVSFSSVTVSEAA